MKVIVGLGNPGRGYEITRHNVGWWVVDHLAGVWHFDRWRRDGDSLVCAGQMDGKVVQLLKPQTYMNLSGQALTPYVRRPAWRPETDLLVMVDEVALPLGSFRLRSRGSAGGHNGLKSIQHALGTQDYARLRVGIRPVDEERIGEDLSNFVLSPFGKGERADILSLLPRFADAADVWLRDGIEAAMNQFNR